MKKHIGILIIIYICTSIAWFILGGATTTRTHAQDTKLRTAVGQLWGTIQNQYAPYVYYQTKKERQVKTISGAETIVETVVETTDHPINFEASDIHVDINLEHRKKGLLWYPTYKVVFFGKYRIINEANNSRDIFFEYTFPTVEGVYDNFSFVVNNKKIRELKPISGAVVQKVEFAPNETKTIEVSYHSQGMDEWWYIFGGGVAYIRNFNLVMTTDFTRINFPDNSISPTHKEKTDRGWNLTWKYADLISGIQIGMEMPQKINPGPFVSRVTFFAPISLLLFLFLMFIITTLKKIRIHPMNYLFISAALFSFHLLLAYLADHLDIHLALVISSVISVFLVISYMRLVAGSRFAFFETGFSQIVYLVLFSYTFFLTGYTGLAITILSILTLFIVMQTTGKIDWEKQFATKE